MGKIAFDKKRFPKTEVKALRERGLTSKKLAQYYHCSNSTISVVLREYGLVKARHIKTLDELYIKSEDAKIIMEKFEQRLVQTAEIVKKREERLLEGRQRRKPKENKTKKVSAEEVPRGYIW